MPDALALSAAGVVTVAGEARQHAARRGAVATIEVGLGRVELQPRTLRAIGALRHRLERASHRLPVRRRRVAAQRLGELPQQVARLDRIGRQHLHQALETADRVTPARTQLGIEPQRIGRAIVVQHLEHRRRCASGVGRSVTTAPDRYPGSFLIASSHSFAAVA